MSLRIKDKGVDSLPIFMLIWKRLQMQFVEMFCAWLVLTDAFALRVIVLANADSSCRPFGGLASAAEELHIILRKRVLKGLVSRSCWLVASAAALPPPTCRFSRILSLRSQSFTPAPPVTLA